MNTPDTYPALFWGYVVIWSLLVGYTLFLGKKVGRLEKMKRHDGE
jgi:CcmD family protein